MIQPGSSPLPVPTFQESDGASPKELLSFLQDFAVRLEHNPIHELREERFKIHSLLGDVDKHFLLPFPLPSEYSWNTLHEKIKLTEVTFDLLDKMRRRVGEVFCVEEDITRRIFTKLVGLAASLDVWIDVPDLLLKEDYATPKTLYANCVLAASGVLQALKGRMTIDKEGPPGWKILQTIAEECFRVSQDLLSVPRSGPFYIHLFSVPRVHSGAPPALPMLRTAEATQDWGKRTFIRVHDPTQIPLLLTLFLDIQLHALCAPAMSEGFVESLIVRAAELARQVYEFLISPACVTSDARRARAMTRVVVAISSDLQTLSPFNALADPMRLHLLVRRLSDGPIDAWDTCDEALLKAFSAPYSHSILRADARSIFVLLKEERWGERGFALRALAVAYLQKALPSLDAVTLHELKQFLQQNDVHPSYVQLRQAIDKDTTVATVYSTVPLAQDALNKGDSATQWQRDVGKVVQTIIEPDDLDWMDSDEDIDEAKFVERALSAIESRFVRPIYNPSADGRVALARQLARLPCALARHLDSRCPPARTALALNPLKTCTFLVTCILDGTEKEVTTLVRKAAYIALARSIRHQTVKCDAAGLDHVTQLALRGMKDPERLVRLNAGRCITELIRLHIHFETAASTYLEPIFSSLQATLTSSDGRFAETVLVTAGEIARIPNPEVLRRVIFCIVLASGHDNSLLRGVAYLQIQTIAKYHGKSVYQLLSSDMNVLARHLVSRIYSHPHALVDICSLLSTSTSSFLRVTLSHTLPHLFANRERENLNVVAKYLDEQLHGMFFNNAAKILAEVFMQTKPGKTKHALNFIVDILVEASSSSHEEVDAQHVIRGEIVEVITEITLRLGDPDDDVVEIAKAALVKVQQTAENRRSQYDTVEETVQALLQQHMLGIVSHLNDRMLALHGKQSADEKRRIIKSLGVFIDLIGSGIQSIAPQIMATMQTTVAIQELSETTLKAWHIFLRVLKPEDLSPHVGPTTATLVIAWPAFTPLARELASDCFRLLIHRMSTTPESMDDVAGFSFIPELKGLWKRVRNFRADWTPRIRLRKLLDRVSNDNTAVASCALQELKAFLLEDDEQFFRSLTSGDVFDPLVGHTMTTLFTAASRDLEGSDSIRHSALECIGIVGALDPDRFKFGGSDGTMIVKHNFQDESESMTFATHLIKDVLVGAFRVTCDIAYQNFLAYTIQELLRFCRFSSSLVTPGSSGSLPLKVRSRWKELPRTVKETVAPLLAGRYSCDLRPPVPVEHPIYPHHTTYRDWMKAWAACLLHRTAGRDAQTIFSACHGALNNAKDAGIAHHLLPHLVLNVLLSDHEQHIQDIRAEILAVLEDQINPQSPSSNDKKRLSAQAVFTLMDHLNRWLRIVRQESSARQRRKAPTGPERGTEEYQLLKVDSILTSIDQSLMAKAAFQCKAYARALMCFEQQLVSMRDTEVAPETKSATYETMHEIYAHLDEPDGMEGISALIITPSLEHQIREHESTGRWTSAQSCWEVRLQYSPGDQKSHIGLLRCLRNLGHYDTMRTHVDGLLMRNPTWAPDLLEYQLESDYIVGNWEEVEDALSKTQQETPSVVVARVLLAMRSGNVDMVESALSTARKILGAPISAAGARDYKRAYQSILDLHMLHELQVIFQEARNSERDMNMDARLDNLQRRLALRLDPILPSFRTREPLLSMRRTALTLQVPHRRDFQEVIGRSWLVSARLARKAAYWQTAYSAILQARRNGAPFLFIQSAKLSKATGEPLKALQELESCLPALKAAAEAKDDNIKTKEAAVLAPKVSILRARWLGELDRHDPQYIIKQYEAAANDLPNWESGWFHFGRFYDEFASTLRSLPAGPERAKRRLVMNLHTIRAFTNACIYGSKHIYQALSRLLTLWLNIVGNDKAKEVYPLEEYKSIIAQVATAQRSIPQYKWYTAFPQLISRVGHEDSQTYAILQRIIRSVTLAYPNQSLWQLISVVKSNQSSRRSRGLEILHKLKGKDDENLAKLIEASMSLCEGLLGLCNHPLHPNDKFKTVQMSKHFPKLYKMLPLPVIIPLQESLRAALPSTPSAEAHHQPFPLSAPTFHDFEDEVEIMRSLARPRKLTITGSDGKTYAFLGKPKDDLRKDARLMDFNAIINNQLKSNSESRRRQLYIRTYGVVTLNEECGFIQWVPDTTPIRFIVAKYYQAQGIPAFDQRTGTIFEKLGTMQDNDAAQFFKKEILSRFRPVMHEWFVETFPEPAAWLSSRIAYTRTSAVMSMVGFILGLGDRHCENILLDTRSGDVVHVDFNCLFEKGKTLTTPERVPFRLTQNIVDGFGITGVEGAFRIACEIAMQALRDNCECLSTVLDAFIHDPLVEWQNEKRENERAIRRGNQVKESTDLVGLARNALEPIRKKLTGIYNLSQDKALEKEIPVSSMVELLITEATDLRNLSKMYIGWSPYF